MSKKKQKKGEDKKTLSKRINDILIVLSAVAKGDFSRYCEIKNLEKPDSLDALSLGINMMISDLGTYARDLEKNIAEFNTKTEELEKMNKIFMGRELKMVELKEEIAELKSRLEKSEKNSV